MLSEKNINNLTHYVLTQLPMAESEFDIYNAWAKLFGIVLDNTRDAIWTLKYIKDLKDISKTGLKDILVNL